MSKQDLIDKLVDEYNEDEEEMRGLSLSDLRERLDEYEDHSDLFPNGGEDD